MKMTIKKGRSHGTVLPFRKDFTEPEDVKYFRQKLNACRKRFPHNPEACKMPLKQYLVAVSTKAKNAQKKGAEYV